METLQAKETLRKFLDRAKLTDWTIGLSAARSYSLSAKAGQKKLVIAVPWVGRVTDTVFEKEASEMILKIERYQAVPREQRVQARESRYRYHAVCPTHGKVGGWTRIPHASYVCKDCKAILDVVDIVTGQKVNVPVVERIGIKKASELEMLTTEIKVQFVGLAGELSPENLSCDGELSASRVAERRREIMRRWNALEMQIGRRVSEDQAWKWYETDDEVKTQDEVHQSELDQAFKKEA